MKNNKISLKISSVFINIYLIIASASFVVPIIWLILSSMKTQGEFDANSMALPKSLNISNFQYVLAKSNMSIYLLNSIRTTIISLVLILLFGFVTGYFLARFNFRAGKFIFGYFLIGMLVPIHSLMVPIYFVFTKMNLSNQWFTLVFPYVAFGLPISIYLVESYVKNIPRELEEAAAIDGASFSRTLFTIILPVVMPVLTTIGIIQFFACWNEFSFALILTSDEMLRTVPLGLTIFKGPFATDYPKMMAAMTIAIIPALAIYSIFSKNIIKGMVAGAVKG